MKARDIMKKKVLVVKENDEIKYVVRTLLQNNISGVPVVDAECKIVGILTEQDLFTNEKGINFPSYIAFLESILVIDGEKQYKPTDTKEIIKLTAKDIMSSPVYTVSLEATAAEIASIMVNRHINHVPVVDEQQRLIGIISRTDLLPVLIHY